MRGTTDPGTVRNEAYIKTSTNLYNNTEVHTAVLRLAYRGTYYGPEQASREIAEQNLVTLQEQHIGPGWRVQDGQLTPPKKEAA